MIRVVHSELVKIRTTNSWWIFGLITLLTTALALLINCLTVKDKIDEFVDPVTYYTPPEPELAQQYADRQAEYVAEAKATFLAGLSSDAANVFTSGQLLGVLLVMLFASLLVTNEFRHQTATTTFLSTPHRTSVIAGKLVTAMLVAFGFWLVVTVIDLVVGSLFFSAYSADGITVSLDDPVVLRAILLNLLAFAVWAVFGIGFGALIRSQVGATVTTLLLYLVGSPLVFVVIGLIHKYVEEDWVWKAAVVVPAVASEAMLSGHVFGLFTDEFPVSPWLGGAVLIGYALLTGTIGTLILRNRDVS